MEQKLAQHAFLSQGSALQKLTQLVNLYLGVDLQEPGRGLLHRFRRGRGTVVNRAIGKFNYKFAHKRSVNRLQRGQIGGPLFERKWGRIRGGIVHDLTIQLGISLRKRAATTVRWV